MKIGSCEEFLEPRVGDFDTTQFELTGGVPQEGGLPGLGLHHDELKPWNRYFQRYRWGPST